MDFGLGRSRRQEWIARRERVALEVFQQRTLELIGPRSRDHVDLPADRATIFRRQDTFDDLHLGHRLDAQDLDLVLAAVVAKATVLRIGLRAAAVDGDGTAAVADAVDAKRAAASDGVVRRTDAGGQQDDVLQIPPRHRDLPHFFADRLDLRRRARLHERRGFLDRHRLGQDADVQHVGLPHGLAGAERESFAAVGLEPLQLDLDGVAPGRQRRQCEFATLIRRRRASKRRALVHDGYRHAGQNASGAVADDSVQRRSRDLRVSGSWREEQRHDGDDGTGNESKDK